MCKGRLHHKLGSRRKGKQPFCQPDKETNVVISCCNKYYNDVITDRHNQSHAEKSEHVVFMILNESFNSVVEKEVRNKRTYKRTNQ